MPYERFYDIFYELLVYCRHIAPSPLWSLVINYNLIVSRLFLWSRFDSYFWFSNFCRFSGFDNLFWFSSFCNFFWLFNFFNFRPILTKFFTVTNNFRLRNSFFYPFRQFNTGISVSYTHLRAHETVLDLVCRL